ncbi:MAG: hypothetical protein OXK77_14500 [Gemmatimonadota bacterium]|nr:hypothetical protein [Gemmatimonadota bacterium]MDE2863906.1 hypothetical protein [Gemmatimonadota bacterium]
MSLIRVRRRRKRDWIDTKKGRNPGTLVILLVVVILIIWYLGRAF